MATLATVAEVLELVETDLPDSVIQLLLDAAEEDARIALGSEGGKTLPTVLWQGVFAPTLGAVTGLTILESVSGYAYTRIEGTVEYNGQREVFTSDTEEFLSGQSLTTIITPITEDGVSVQDGEFTLTVDTSGKVFTFDLTTTMAAIRITRILGLRTFSQSSSVKTAVLDLVRISVDYRGLQQERTGEHGQTWRDYHSERSKILTRVLFNGVDSLAF